MGVVEIPPDPVSGGSLSVRIELSPEELQKTVELFKQAIAHVSESNRRSDESRSTNGTAASSKPAARPPAASSQGLPNHQLSVTQSSTASSTDTRALDAEVSNIAMRFQTATNLSPDTHPNTTSTPATSIYRNPDPTSFGTHPTAGPPTMPPPKPTYPSHQPPPTPTYVPPARPPHTAAPPRQAPFPAPHPQPIHRTHAPQPIPQPTYHPPPQPQPANPYSAPAPRQPHSVQPPPQHTAPPPSQFRPSAASIAASQQLHAGRPAASGHRYEVRGPSWTHCYSTQPVDHNSDTVHTMVYCPEFDTLPGGDGHGGWLISSSRHMLNLWECTKGGSFKGEPSLMLMHSQMTDFVTVDIAVEAASQQMFGASLDSRLGSECVSVHSLSAAQGFMAYKYRYILGEAAPSRGRQGPALQQVVSLHTLGGQMRNCCAASYNGQVYIFEAAAHSANAQKPRAEWKAHEACVTVLHRSPFSPMLFTGAQDGSIHMWSLKERPVHPLKRMAHQQGVTGIQQCSDHLLATSGLDCKVLLWDLRMAAAPVHTASPDTTPVLKLAVSPVGDCVAAATQRGLCTVDLIDMSGEVVNVVEQPLQQPFQGIEWNHRTGELYACGARGVIQVFRQRF